MSRSSPFLRATWALLFCLAILHIAPQDGYSQETTPTDPKPFSTGAIKTSDSSAASALESEKLAHRIDQTIQEHAALAGAQIGIAIYDLAHHSWVYRKNSKRGFNVASNVKIITTVAALVLLGPNFRFRTSLAATTIDQDPSSLGDLYLRSLADPTLTSGDLHELAEKLANSGVKKIRGRIIVDDTYFDEANLPPHFNEQPKEQAAFRAPVSATSLHANALSIVVTPNLRAHRPARVVASPHNDYVQITGLVQTITRGRTRLKVQSTPSPGKLIVQVSGQIRQGSGQRQLRIRVPEPAAYIGSTLRRILAQQGLQVANKPSQRGKMPPQAKILASIKSPPLAEIIRDLGKHSNNYVAEMLLKTLGAEQIAKQRRPATWADGQAAIRDFLADYAKLAPGTYRYDNGSGLFNASTFSPQQMVTLLAKAYQDFRIAADLLSSLSISGTDGTLRRRMTRSPATWLVRAKTGTLATVSTLSGFYAVNTRAPMAFSIFINEVPKNKIQAARDLQDQIVTAALDSLHAQSP